MNRCICGWVQPSTGQLIIKAHRSRRAFLDYGPVTAHLKIRPSTNNNSSNSYPSPPVTGLGRGYQNFPSTLCCCTKILLAASHCCCCRVTRILVVTFSDMSYSGGVQGRRNNGYVRLLLHCCSPAILAGLLLSVS